jgi:type IV secretion system protein VirB11
VYPLDDFEAKGILTLQAAAHTGKRLEAHATIRQTLEYAVREGYTVVIAGPVGSAKTSLANALLDILRDSDERIVIVEDDPELRCEAEEVETLRTSMDPLVTMRDLCKDLLRISPDHVVIGEVRDGAALDMLKAFQTGHPGLCTVHAESAIGTLLRLEQLVEEVSATPQRPLIGEAIDVICHMEKYGRSWRVTSLLAVDGWDGHEYNTRSLV